MYFDDYKKYPAVKLNPKLLWEYDLSDFDYDKMMSVVIQRVVERGWPQDWYFILNRYGVESVRSTIMNLPYLNDKDMCFVSNQFNIPLTSLKCYAKKQSVLIHWDS